MSDFVPGIELSRAFYAEVVAPLVAGVPHSAALIGPGSEVLAFDTGRSADHDWGPRVLVFTAPEAVEAVETRVVAGLPGRFRGFETVFDYHGVVRPGVEVADLGVWLEGRLGFDPEGGGGISLLDWLSVPWQSLAEVTGGEVFHDGLGRLEEVRAALRWYPADVWRYVLACQWRRIAQEEPFPGRCGEVGDELGSAVVAARLAREVMRLALLLRRRYPPYAKWLGSALARLPGSAELGEALGSALAARSWRARESGLAAAYGRVAALQNRVALAERLDERVRGFHDRPFQVIGGDRFARALLEAVSDPVVRALPLVGNVDQVSDSAELLMAPSRARAVTAAALGLGA
ncbi:DUF4037 domain-containing protein [Nonomuraea cavernae]|uniref:DUF4037 domain-containing protein n=1 Tax=Nonomuraea cavernae TaxID=2045107 RepID=A0A918DF16_9ACTN|nr:DUF4037 domain-containing protein [Nonomuraea cavernae]MCA2184577.1 DUF4037 domain-containing protein [Nonomuraea cavernae]GGO63369.1 hypothetical protein GCM10012289_10270 [Nonomuraea cavernae]